uniref:AD domain-containing protein n=1 Tax=Syphacia muris TaxID=451379 RepID=A0A0N5A8E5_9BILA
MRVMTAFDATTSGGSLVDCNSNQTDSAGTDIISVFPVGSTVKCTTRIPTTITGEVICYDNQARMLVLRDTSGPKAMLRFVNLALVEEVDSLSEGSNEAVDYEGDSLPFDQAQVQERLRRAVARKKASLMQANVSLEGQQCFIALRKTLEDVKWDGDCISVLGCALVRPPYTTDSIERVGDPTNNAGSQAVDHIRKIVRFLSKNCAFAQGRASSDDAPADPTPSH